MGGERRWPGLEVTPANSHGLLREKLDRFFREGARPSPVLALEVGCGDGRISTLVYELLVKWHGCTGARLCTLDIAMDKILKASSRFRRAASGGIHPIRGDLYDLPVPTAGLDRVIALNVFFWADRPKLLREIHRVLKEEGRLFVYDVIPTTEGARPLATFSFGRDQIARSLSL